MAMTKRTPVDDILARHEADLHARHPLLASRAVRRVPAVHPHDLITLGTTGTGSRLTIADTPRLEHAHLVGATGCGKSTFLLNCILQDMARGRGVCVLDPHGGHPDSLINTVLRFLFDHNWLATRKVNIIAPNCPEQVVGFNPLAPLPGTDPAVIADAMVKAFARVWGDEDPHEKPLMLRILRAVFTTLAELRLTLPDAEDLLDYDDRRGLRKDAIARLENEQAKRTLEDIERRSKEPRGFNDFVNHVMGPENRLAEFLSCDALRSMFSMNRAAETPDDAPDNTIDLLDIIDHGKILLVDLQHGPRVSEAATDLLGKILLRYFFMLMPHRRPYQLPGQGPRFHPFFVYVDECHRYATDDIGSLLVEARKFGIGVALAHQFLGQLGMPGEKIYDAARNSTEIKAIFRIKSPEEAETLARDVIPLDMEMPVQASIRPVQVGYEIGRLSNESYSVHEGEGESTAIHAAEAISQGKTVMQSWMRSIGHAVSKSQGSGSTLSSGSATSEGFSAVNSHMDSMAYSYDPNTRTFIGGNMPLGMNVGAADGSARAALSSRSVQIGEATSTFSGVSESDITTEGEAVGIALSEAFTKSRGRSDATNTSRGRTQGTGSSEALFPTYENLPTAFHPKDKVLYMAAEVIRDLPVGRAFVRFRDLKTVLTIPPPRKSAR